MLASYPPSHRRLRRWDAYLDFRMVVQYHKGLLTHFVGPTSLERRINHGSLSSFSPQRPLLFTASSTPFDFRRVAVVVPTSKFEA